jgi:hypothetical protein
LSYNRLLAAVTLVVNPGRQKDIAGSSRSKARMDFLGAQKG